MKFRTELKYIKRRAVAETLISTFTTVTYIGLFVYAFIK